MIRLLLTVLILGQSPAIEDKDPPTVGFVPCEVFQKGRALTLYARFDDASPLFEPKVVYRISGETTWRNAPFTELSDGSAWRASIPSRELTGAVEYFIEVFDENGNGPARVGSPERPLFARAARKAPECVRPGQLPSSTDTPIEEAAAFEADSATAVATTPDLTPEKESRCAQPDRPMYCTPWFWVAAGGAAVVATAVIVAIAADHSSGRGYPDHVTLVVQPQALGRGP